MATLYGGAFGLFSVCWIAITAVFRYDLSVKTDQSEQHPVLRGTVLDILYDWNVILRPVAEPHLPLANDAAEQALLHWVIARTISHGTRSEEGSRAISQRHRKFRPGVFKTQVASRCFEGTKRTRGQRAASPMTEIFSCIG